MAMNAPQSPSISSDTIARIFKTCAFTQENTIITEDAMLLVGKYMELFVREAALRSLENKDKVKKENSAGLVDETKMLQHEDLEKISGILLLDF